MANEGEERFLRSSYLLLKGTFYLAKTVLLREAENVHQQTGRDLDDLLKDYEQKLKHQFRNKKQLEILFPPSGKTNVEDWDISLLTGVLLIVFRQSLSNVDRTAITNIQYQRNNVYAHCKVASLDEIDYIDTCNNLEDTFNILASRCGDEVKQECDAIIQTCLNGALDRTSLVEHLKQLAEKDDDLLVEIIAKIEPIELREKVLKALQQPLQGQRRIKVKVVESHLCIWGTDQDQDNIAMAENIIVTVTNEAIRRAQTCEGYTRIREIIQEILDEITSHTGVKPISAEKGCVRIRFDCCSYEHLSRFIIYMESKDMKERLNNLADSLSRLLNTKEKLEVSLSVSVETLKSILDEITPKVQREYKRSVHIPIQIESAEGIKRVMDLFEGGGLTNNLQKLSEALTEKVGAKINVKPSINMKQINEALQDFDTDPEEDPARQIGKTNECRSEEGATAHKGELYVDAEEGGDESSQIKLADHEEDIYTGREEPEEQSIQEKPSDETSRQKDNAKDESSDKNETEDIVSRLQSLIIDVGTDVLRNIFDQRLQGVTLDDFLAREMENIKILNLHGSITDAQYNLLYPPGDQPSNIAKLDITLILCLLRRLPSLRAAYIERNLVRLCYIMDQITRISLFGGFQQSSFHTIKTDIEQVLLRLNATAPKPLSNLNERIKRNENKTLDPAAERKNLKLIFNQWWHMEFRLKPAGQRMPIVPMKEKKYIKADLKSIKAEEEETSIQKDNDKDESSDENETEDIVSRLQSLIIDVGTDVLRNIFDQRLQGVTLDDFLAHEMENIKHINRYRGITDAQYNLLYPPGGQPSNIAELDITLILRLLRYLPSLRSNEVAAYIRPDLVRLCYFMDQIARISLLGGFQQSSFHTIKTDIEQVLLRLNATAPKPLSNLNERIKRNENKTLDPAAERKNQKLFNQWWHMELRLNPVRHRMSIVPMKEKKYIKADLKSIKAEEEETSIQKDNDKDESSDENETEVTFCSLVQNQECVFRLQSLVIDVGTDVLRNIFDQRLQGVALDDFLAKEMENLKNLKQQRAITNAQFNLLYPPGGQLSNIAELDITLILCLLRHLPSLRFKDFYKCQRPMPADVSVGTDIRRLCDIMNEIVHSSWSGRFHESSFNTIKTDIEEILLRLNATVPKPLENLNERIKGYENKTLDPAAKKRNQKIFNQWKYVWFSPVIPLMPSRTRVPKKGHDFGDTNPQVTTHRYRSVMEGEKYMEQYVTSIKKDFKSIEADLKSIKGEDIEHGVSKGNEAEST